MEIIYLIIGIYWVVAAIIEFLNNDTSFKDTYKSFKDYKMPLYAAFWFLLVVGFILFVPFTFPKTLWRGAKNNIKFRKQINKQKREKKEEAKRKSDPMLMAKRVIDNLNKYSSGSVVWPVITVESNKSQIWNELNKINEYVFMYIAREKAKIQKLNEQIEQMKDVISERELTIQNLTQKPPQKPSTLSLPDPINNASDFMSKSQQRPIREVFDARTCNLIKKYEQTYGGKFVIIKDMAEMSRNDLWLLRGVGLQTFDKIQSKLLTRKIQMKP